MNTYKRHRFPPDIISHAVWFYHRFNLSHRDIEDLLAERGITVSREAIRLWCIKFGALYARRLKRKHQGYGDTFFIDEVQHPRIAERCRDIAELLGVTNPVTPDDIRLDDGPLAPGYGHLNPATRAAIETAAQTEALILDPVYSGKAMAGYLGRTAAAAPGQSLLFIHTGGTPAVFAYGDEVLTGSPAER